jgi:uncharacterized Tic20 family protein
MSKKNETITTENRLLAALAHGSILAQGLGLLAGVLIYITQREKSRFAALQALQAAVYQFFSLIITIALWIIWGVFYTISMIPLIQQMETHPDAAPPPLFWISTASSLIPLFLMLIIGLYALWGAWNAWQGKDFRYILIGKWLERSGLWKKNETQSPDQSTE